MSLIVRIGKKIYKLIISFWKSVWNPKNTANQGLALAIFFLAWFSFITPSDRFADPDAFYHITVAKIISETGSIHTFPWLDLTALGENFADQHFLFHILQIPFLKLVDPLIASRVSSIIFAALCMLGISFIFYKFNLKHWWIWPILLTFTQPFTTRLIQGKASPLAILFWFAGIAITLQYLRRDNPCDYPFLRRDNNPTLHISAGTTAGSRRSGDEKGGALRASLQVSLIFLRERFRVSSNQRCINPSGNNFSTDKHKVRPYAALLLVFLVSLLFSLTHGGWILLPLSILLIIVSNQLFNIFKPSRSLVHARHSLEKGNPKNKDTHSSGSPLSSELRGDDESMGMARVLFVLSASIAGSLLGLLVHPNRDAIFGFLKVQIYDVAVASPQVLRLGTEWNSGTLADFFGMFGAFGILLLLILLGRILSQATIGDQNLTTSDNSNESINVVRGTPALSDVEVLDVGRREPALREIEGCDVGRITLLLLPLTILLFAASLKNIRFAEYFQPLLALITALLASITNWKVLLQQLKLPDTKYKILDTLVPKVIYFSIFMIIVQHVISAYSSGHFAKRFLNNQYQIPMQAISALAKPGDRVYHSMWDEFPILFYNNQNLKYISGLDPTFLYKSSSTLALDYQDLIFNSSSTQADAYNLIHDRLHSDFILVDYERWPHFAGLIASDNRYTFLAEGNGGRSYKVE